MKIRDLQTGDRVYVTINKIFAPVQRKVGPNFIFESTAGWTSRNKDSFTQCRGTVMDHVTVNNEPALKLQFITIVNPNKTGIAHIVYYSIVSLWLYQGETNINTVVSQEVSDNRNHFPYAAYQLPPVNIYREKISLVW